MIKTKKQDVEFLSPSFKGEVGKRLGIGLLLVPVFTLFIVSTSFWLGKNIQSFMFPLAVVFSITALFFVTQRNIKHWLVSSVILVLSIVGFCFLSMLVLDYSYDGQWYHQEMIWQLANGWNPFTAHHAPEFEINTRAAIWVNHYSKGLEMVQATIYSLTGNIESAKAVNFMLIGAAALLFFSFLRRQFSSFSTCKNILFTILFLLCPVVLRQAFTFLIDWAQYALLLMLIPALIMRGKSKSRTALVVIAAVVLLAASIKFNFLFWCGFAVLCYCVYWIFTKNYKAVRQIIITCIVSGGVAVVFVNYNPYITNTLDHHHPLYPLMGEGKQDIMSANTPFILREKSPVNKVLISLVAQPNGYLRWKGNAFEVNETYFTGIKSADSRLGGFGGFFIWAVLIAIGFLLTSAIRGKDIFRNKRRLSYSIFAGILFIALFILPSGWWARYVPFFYAFPLVICLYFESENSVPLFKKMRWIIYIMVVINAVASVWGVTRVYCGFTEKINIMQKFILQSQEPVKIYFHENFAMKLKFDNANVPYKAVSNEEAQIGAGINPDVFLEKPLPTSLQGVE